MPADMSAKEGEQMIHQDGSQTDGENIPLNNSRSTRTLQGPRAPYSKVALVCAMVLGAALIAGTVALRRGSVLREQSSEKRDKDGVIGLIQTKRHDGSKSKSAPHDAKASRSVSSKCSGEDEDCSSSKCCSQPGMQCYEKSKGKAYCRASCTVGPDFSSDKHEIWTCDKLGKRANGTAEPAPKMKFEEIPVWVDKKCSEHGDTTPHDCSKTMCCKGSGMQCFQKEEGWAICDQECMPGEREGDGYWQCNRLGPRTPAKCPDCAPKSAPRPDIVILFFERDLCKMKYTARSLGVNDPDKNLGDVYLMWVSSHSASEYQTDIDEIKASIEQYKTVHFTDWSQRMASAQPHPIGGWHAQQMVKLKIAFEIQSEFYIVLDSKNTLIQPVTPDTFFTPCGQGIIQAEFPYDKIPVPHSDWYARSAAALNLNPPDSGFWPASITPIVMHRQTVLDMLQQLGEDPNPQAICNGRLCEAIGAFSDSGVGATEFTLYTLFAYSKRADDTFNCIHSIEKMQHFKVKYSKSWKDEMLQMISGLGFPEDLKQITVSDGDGWPIDWTPDGEGEEPGEDKFPLMFEDLTKKWASSLWRGEESNAKLLVQVNLHTLSDVVGGVRQFPIMFGAQPASLVPMSEEERDVAVGHLVDMYEKANLYDPNDDLVECTIGWKN